jgi:hypothetical protein
MTTPDEIKRMMKAEKNGVQPAKEFVPEILDKQFDFKSYLLKCLIEESKSLEEMQKIANKEKGDPDKKFFLLNKLHDSRHKAIQSLIQFIRVGQFELQKQDQTINFCWMDDGEDDD